MRVAKSGVGQNDIVIRILTAVGQNELQVIEVEAGGKALITEHVSDKLILLVLQYTDFFVFYI